MMSSYFKHSEGLSPGNLDSLEQLAILLYAYRSPWILAADFNMDPETLAASGWLELVGGTIMHSNQPTCGNANYDYFVVGGGLQRAVVKVQTITDTDTYPHCGVRLLMKAGSTRRRRRAMVKSAKVPAAIPPGPL